MALDRLVVATRNAGKLAEFKRLLRDFPFQLMNLAELNIASPAETGCNFAANALLKARHASRVSGCAAIADDSGLEVAALHGAPGIFSARYAGLKADDAANNAKLIEALRGIPQDQRRARYVCALAFVPAPDAPPHPIPVFADATWEGYILEAPRGSGGFGYDPYFWVPEAKMSAGELDPTEKNRLSHRGRAMTLMLDRLSHLGYGMTTQS